jgi:hypothetical protein
MNIIFHFQDQPLNLEIELLDNPAVRSWANHFKEGYQAGSFLQERLDFYPGFDFRQLTDLLTICQQNIQKLKEHGYEYTGPLPIDCTLIDRNFTNCLHRFFTHTSKAVSLFYANYRTSNNEHEIESYLNSLLHSINTAVHNIESWLPSVPNLGKIDLNEVYISADINGGEYYKDKTWWSIQEQFRNYHSAAHADVILGDEILGKTILRSYLDGDNPNDWDTSGHYANAGSLQILTTTNRQMIYQSEDFISWLKKHKLNPSDVYYDFPIGNIVNKQNLNIIKNKMMQMRDPNPAVPAAYVPVTYSFSIV